MPVSDLTVRIINTGNRATGDLALTLSGANADVFTLPETTISSLAVGEEADITITPLVNLTEGTYMAMLTVSGEELESKSIQITYDATGTGMDDVVANQFSIFPNPAKNDIFIQSKLQIEKVEICTLTGTLIILENNFNEKISVSALQHGVYLLKVYTNKGVTISKIVKE